MNIVSSERFDSTIRLLNKRIKSLKRKYTRLYAKVSEQNYQRRYYLKHRGKK